MNKRQEEMESTQNLGLIRKAFGPRDDEDAHNRYLAWLESFRGDTVVFPKLELSKREKILELARSGEANKAKIAKIVGCKWHYIHNVFKTSYKQSRRELQEKKCKAAFNCPDTPNLYNILKVQLAGQKVHVAGKKHSKLKYIIYQYRDGKSAKQIYDDFNIKNDFVQIVKRHRNRFKNKFKVSMGYIYRCIHKYRNSKSTDTYDGRMYNRNKRNTKLLSNKRK